MNFIRLMLITLVVACGLSGFEQANAFWCWSRRPAPVPAHVVGVAPAERAALGAEAAQRVVQALQDRPGWFSMSTAKNLGLVLTGALLMYIVVTYGRSNTELPTFCKDVISSTGKLLTNSTELIERCMSSWINLAKNSNGVLSECYRTIEAEIGKCNRAGIVIEGLQKQIAAMSDSFVQQVGTLSRSFTQQLANVTDACSQNITALQAKSEGVCVNPYPVMHSLKQLASNTTSQVLSYVLDWLP